MVAEQLIGAIHQIDFHRVINYKVSCLLCVGYITQQRSSDLQFRTGRTLVREIELCPLYPGVGLTVGEVASISSFG